MQRRTLGFAALGVAVVATTLGGIVSAAGGRDHVARHVSLAGHDIGGLNRPALVSAVTKLNVKLRDAPVEVDAPKGGFHSTVAKLGATIDIPRTVDGALAVGHTGNPFSRGLGWLHSLIGERRAPVQVRVDRQTARAAVIAADRGPTTPAKEPSLALKAGVFVAVDGAAGSGIDPSAVAKALPEAIRRGNPIRLHVERGRVDPQFSRADAEALARQANKLDKLELAVQAGDTTATVPPAMLAGWIVAAPSRDALVLAVDGAKAVDDLARVLAGAGQAPTETKFSVVDGAVVISPGKAGVTCCDPASTSTLLTDAIRKPPARPIQLQLRNTEPKITAAEAAKLGINEVVGTFTTFHPAGQPRVANIHLIANLVRGAVILPNSRFSINGYVGPRTAAKGFVSAHVIEDGKFAEGIGGGISQFATTLFNAAFFAGLDIPAYQSHTIYISRYPYGREATMGYPGPDLVLGNNTPYGVLIWPTYTASSLTLTLYSTKYAPGAQTGQTQTDAGACTVVVTERTRTLPDGTKKIDHFRANYQHQEGVNCNGTGTPVTSSTVAPKTTTTTGKPAPTTTSPTTAPATTTTHP